MGNPELLAEEVAFERSCLEVRGWSETVPSIRTDGLAAWPGWCYSILRDAPPGAIRATLLSGRLTQR